MANEAVNIEAPRIIKRYNVADAAAIPKGTILMMSGASLYALASSGNAPVFAGIAVEEKTGGDGVGEIGAAIDGTWDIFQCGTASTQGAIVCLSGANLVRTAVAGDLLTGAAFGKLLETGTASAANRVRLGLV